MTLAPGAFLHPYPILSSLIYRSSDRLLFLELVQLWAVRFDPRRLEPEGAPTLV